MARLDASDHRRFKEEVYAEFARIAHALANPRRLEMIDLLAQRERTVEDLASELETGITNASQHLQVLLRARLVEVRRKGTYAHYRLADDQVYHAWLAVRELAENRLSEVKAIVQRYLGDRGELEGLDAYQLQERVKTGEVTLIDVRPREEYRAGHLPGARSAPLEELEEFLDVLPRECEIVAYCRGPYCVFSDEAVEALRQHGFQARRLHLGPADWKALGLPVEEVLVEEAKGV